MAVGPLLRIPVKLFADNVGNLVEPPDTGSNNAHSSPALLLPAASSS